jgi:nicotinamide riboside kinase
VRGFGVLWAESDHLTSISDIEMQQTIMTAQLEQERVARSVAGSSAVRIVLSDRSAIDPITYAVLTAANEDEGQERMRGLVGTADFQAALGRYRHDGTFVLFKPVPEWLVDDGVRNVDMQDQSLEVFRVLLKELEIPYIELGGEVKDLQARVAFAKRLIMSGRSASLCTRERDQNTHNFVPCRSETVRDRGTQA